MPSRKAQLEAWLRERAPVRIEPADFDELLGLLAPVSESALRRLLRNSATPLHPLAAGVNQDSFADLRDSLLALAAWYEQGNTETRRLARGVVIIAKDHAKLASRNSRTSPEKKAEKAEMVTWMLTWLENPGIFPVWVRVRERAAGVE